MTTVPAGTSTNDVPTATSRHDINVPATPTDGTAAVDLACARARAAIGQLAALPEREAALRSLAAALDPHADTIIKLARAETGLAETRLRGELQRTKLQLQAFADAVRRGEIFEATIDRADPAASPVPRPDLRRLLIPVGPVAVFSASNFPLAFSVLGGDTASALAAGCPVVVKAHPGHTRLSAYVGAIAERATASAIVSVVHGVDSGLALVAHPAIRAVGFTGSEPGARALLDRIARRDDPIPFYGELGSLNPVIVTRAAAEADGPAIMRGLVASFTQSAGQLCTKPGLVFVPSGLGLADILDAELGGIAPSAMLTPAIKARFTAQIDALTSHDNIRVIVAPGESNGLDVTPVALLTSADAVPDPVLEECFGPVTTLVEYQRLDDVFDVLGRLDGSLTATVHRAPTEQAADLRPLVDRLVEISGRVLLGGWPTGVAVAPAMQHGGPWPAATSPLHTSVGLTAARRFLRPVCFQDMPDDLLPEPLRDANPCGIVRHVDGVITRAGIDQADPARAGA
jgi:acyl-CoA reductase-like NAD-dependent aldehyde dehydrogenase